MYTATATTDERGIVTEWGEEAQQVLGYLPEEIVGRPAADLFVQDAAQAAWPALTGRGRWTGRATLRHRDGHRVEVRLFAHRGVANGGAGEWFLVFAVESRPGPPPPENDALVRWGFAHSPCILAIYDTELRSVQANADMERALAMSDDRMRGLRLSQILAHPDAEKNERAMRHVLETGERQFLENYLRLPGESRQHAWSISLAPLRDPAGSLLGVCFAARDTTEQHRARQRLLLVTDASTRIGSTLDIARTAQELVDVAVPQLADFSSVDLLTFLDRGDEPPPGPLTGQVTMRRAAQQSVLEGVPEALVAVGSVATYPEFSPPAECLAADRPAIYEMTDSAIAKWAAFDPPRAAKMRSIGAHSAMVVPLRARGVTLGVALFARHRRPEPFDQDDLWLAEEITARAAVCIDNARRYTRERTTAATLQRSLLPQTFPDQSAVEFAFRYLPAGAEAGVGGDWFDVIPLSGARVALVVGDVVGHGIQASATMGRLRTAVHTLADIDLPPDELLTHLDDLVIRLSAETDTQTAGDIGATCLYAVYDPVSRRCTLARAGHPPPAVITPDGAADILDLPAGPPLGLGGLPFEAAEVELPEGSLLAFYTDGLIETRRCDVDEGLSTLCQALRQPAPSLDAICDTVLKAMLPARPDDDIALLLARTRSLGAGHVATWDVPSDPSCVAPTRQNAADQLTAWGLEEGSFTTELVVSELVTNAIRYGEPPIQLRLIHDRSLICEVSDGSSTAPHLRRARVLDEGGRGLLLVAQLTQRWGTRHTPHGKTIWAEQKLPPS
ncbi:SpoIIE family protein phosphatase [Streptomyces heilongjiangensis]